MSAVEKGLGLDKNDHSRASWEVYHERGNMVRSITLTDWMCRLAC
jgi:hypothetical protein